MTLDDIFLDQVAKNRPTAYALEKLNVCSHGQTPNHDISDVLKALPEWLKLGFCPYYDILNYFWTLNIFIRFQGGLIRVLSFQF